jgi:hypothetical protein
MVMVDPIPKEDVKVFDKDVEPVITGYAKDHESQIKKEIKIFKPIFKPMVMGGKDEHGCNGTVSPRYATVWDAEKQACVLKYPELQPKVIKMVEPVIKKEISIITKPMVMGAKDEHGCNGTLPPQYATVWDEKKQACVQKYPPKVITAQIQKVKPVIKIFKPQVMGAKDEHGCNGTLSPRYATVWDEEKQACVQKYPLSQPKVVKMEIRKVAPLVKREITIFKPTVSGAKDEHGCNGTLPPRYATKWDEEKQACVPMNPELQPKKRVAKVAIRKKQPAPMRFFRL